MRIFRTFYLIFNRDGRVVLVIHHTRGRNVMGVPAASQIPRTPIWVLIYPSKIPHFLSTEKVRLEHVDLEDQKVRLRAVWMGRKIESFWSSILGSILELNFRVEKSAVLEAQKTP